MTESTKHVKTDVSLDHIERGEREAPKSCPIALALCEATGFKAHVEFSTIELHQDGEARWCIDTPSDLLNFIKRFDRGDNVAPFALDLEFHECEVQEEEEENDEVGDDDEETWDDFDEDFEVDEQDEVWP